MSAVNSEIILAEAQDASCKFGKMEAEGTLVLTNKRLVFVRGNIEEDLERRGIAGVPHLQRFRFADINELSDVPQDPSNLSINLEQIETEKGSGGIIGAPSLKIKWNENGAERICEFTADISSGNKKSLKDWAHVIEELKAGRIKPVFPNGQMPKRDALEFKVLSILGDMQEKGLFAIEEEVEEAFKVDLDPDEVEASCEQLVKLGLVDKIPDSSGDNFYRRRSPLGQDDLST